MNYIIDAFILILVIVSFWGIKAVKPFSGFQTDCLSMDMCGALRGMAALSIVFVHLSGHQGVKSIILNNFLPEGFIIVSLFFLFSGYGLQKNYIKAQEKYEKNFLKRRLPKVLIPYVAMILIYSAVYIVNGDSTQLSDKIYNLPNGELIVSNSWYIIVSLAFYVAFFFIMKIAQSNKIYVIVLGCIFWILEVAAIKVFKFGYWWFISTHIIVIGLILASFEKPILYFLKKYYWIVTAFSAVMYFVLRYLTTDKLSDYLYYIAVMAEEVFFVIFIVCSTLKIRVGNKMINWVGEISLEIYLIHGLIMYVFRSKNLYISNDALYCILVVCITVCCAAILHRLFKLVLDKYMRLTLK